DIGAPVQDEAKKTVTGTCYPQLCSNGRILTLTDDYGSCSIESEDKL
ncbi:hypothetical protein HMPREF9444_02260, partial [Succinatimonas hippei YIT 12066]